MSNQDDDGYKKWYFEQERIAMDKWQRSPWDNQPRSWYYQCEGCGDHCRTELEHHQKVFCPVCIERLREVIARQKQLKDL